jgi:hypothetical protein
MTIRSKSLIFALLIFGCSSEAQTTYTWTGNASAPANNQDWGTPQNWSPNTGFPGAGDTAVIGGNKTVQVNSAITVDTVSLGNGSTLTSGGSLTINRSFLCLAGNLQVAGGITVNGSMSIEPATPTVPISTVFTLLTINGGGSCTVSANAALWFGSNAQLINNGTLTVADTGSVVVPSGSSGVLIVNNGGGHFIGGNARCSTSSSVFSNAPSGTVQINGGATFEFDGIFANSGTVNVGGGGTANIFATAALHGGGSFTGAGLAVLTGQNTLDGTVTVSGNLQMNTSALTLNGTLEVQGGGNFNWLGGTLTGAGTNVTGTVQVDSSGTMLINNVNSGLTLRNCCVTNNGTLNWTNGGTLFMGYNAQIVNQFNFYVYGDGTLQPLGSGSPGYASASVVNTSRFYKYGGSTNYETLVNMPYFGSGALASTVVYRGKLQFNGGGEIGSWGTSGGSFFGCVLELGAGNYNTKNAIFSGDGDETNYFSILMLPGVNINVPAGQTLWVNNANFQQAGGTISGNGQLVIGNGSVYNAAFTWSGGTIALTNPVSILVKPTGAMNISAANNHDYLYGGGLQNNGTINWINDNSVGGVTFYDNTFVDNFGTFNIQCNASLHDNSVTFSPVFTNEPSGTITKANSTGTSYIALKMVSLGRINADSGTLEFYQFDDSTAGVNPDIFNMAGGNLYLDHSTTNHGIIQGTGTITVNSGAGSLTVEDMMSADSINFSGNNLVNDGTISEGDAPGTTPLSYSYTQTANGTIDIPIRGTNIATVDFGRMTGFGGLTLAGTLRAYVTDGYAPPVGASFPFLAGFSQRSGTFNTAIIPQGMQLNYTSGGATLVVTGTVPVQIISPMVTNGQFQFGFNTVSNRSYTVQYRDSLATGTWTFLTNFTATGSYWQPPPLAPLVPQRFYRVSNP